MCFLTRAFRNVLGVRVGKLIVRLWRVWGGWRSDECWKMAATAAADAGAAPTAAAGAGFADTPPARKPNPNLNERHPRALFCLKLYNSCCYARYSSGNNCNVVVKLVQEFHCFDTFYFRSVKPVRRERHDVMEANSYNRALALRNSRMIQSLNIFEIQPKAYVRCYPLVSLRRRLTCIQPVEGALLSSRCSNLPRLNELSQCHSDVSIKMK